MPDQNTIDEKIKSLSIDSNRKSLKFRKKSYKKYWISGIIILIILLFSFRSKFLPPEIEVAKVVKMEPPKVGQTILTVSGYVVPDHQIELAPKIIGRVKWIGIDKGDKVKKGQEIVKIEDREYQAQVDQAKARLASAKARLAKLKTGSRTEEIKIAQAQMQEAETNYANSQANYKRIEKLFNEGAVSKEAYDNASTQYAVTKSQWDSAKENYQMVKEGPRIEEIHDAEAEVNAAEASLQFAETQLSDTIIRAPSDGTILERLIEVGEMVSNTSYGGTRGARVSLLTMADLHDIQVEIDLNETDIHKVHMHQPCMINLEAFPDIDYKGELVEIAPQANRQKATVQVKVQFLNPDNKVKPEMNAKVSFLNDFPPEQTGDRTKIYVPARAIITENGKSYIFIVNDNKISKKEIQKGSDGEFGTEIESGLSGNETIAVNGLDQLSDGKRIRIKKT